MSAPQNDPGPPPPRADAPEECGCAVCGALAVLGRKWAAHVLGVVHAAGPVRFNALQRRLGGVSARTLSDRLTDLGALGLVERVDHGEVPPRVEYRITAQGAAVVEALAPLEQVLAERPAGPAPSDGA